MATKKKSTKSTNWLDDQASELTEAFADKVFDEKTKKVKWPKITIGSHSTRTEYEDGRVELVTDWEALQRDVREAIASYESRLNCETVEVEAAPKKKAAAMTAKKKAKK
jgi:hypothetical protein